MEILECHKLTIKHFPDVAAALQAADKMLQHQRSFILNVEEDHPDIIIGDPMLDQFWYCQHQGTQGVWL